MNPESNDRRPSLQQKQSLSQIVCCKLCFTLYRSPKLLPCLHSFCACCLENLVAKSDKHMPLQCPSCAETFELPAEGVSGLQSNVVLERVISNSVQNIQVDNKKNVMCSPVSQCFGLNDQSFSDANAFQQNDTSPINSDDTAAMILTMNDFIAGSKKEVPTQEETRDATKSEPEVDNRRTTDRKKSLNRLSGEFDWLAQDQRPLVKSLSDLSSFSISSLKFEPPADILEGFELFTETEYASEASSFKEEMYPRDLLEKELSELQSEALRIIYSIDDLNGEVDRLRKRKLKLYKRIQDRSAYLEDIVARLERRFLLQLEAFSHENHQAEIVERQKKLLHKRLKGILGMTDFMRLLLDHGEIEELKLFQERITQRKKEFNGQNIYLDKSEIEFTVPMKNAESVITELFGSLDAFQTTEFVPSSDSSNDSAATDPAVSEFDDNLPELQMDQFDCNVPGENSEMYCFDYDYSPITDNNLSQPLDIESLNSKLQPLYRQTQLEAVKARRLSLIKSQNLSPRHTLKQHKVTSPLTCSRGVSDTESPTKPDDHTSFPISENGSKDYSNSKYPPSTRTRSTSGPRRRMARRHTEGNIETSQKLFDLNDEYEMQCRNAQHEPQDRKKLRNLTDDIQRTKRMMALCKKQLIDAQMSKVPAISPSSSTVSGDDEGEYGHVSARERYEQTKERARIKTSKWRSTRSTSRESISSCDGET